MKLVFVPFLALLTACNAIIQNSSDTESASIEGAWRLTLSEVLTPDGRVIAGTVQESLLLFAAPYYSMNWATGVAATPSATALQPTDEEKLARYGTLIINAGQFELAEGVLTIRPEFALIPEYVGGIGVFDVEIAWDTLDLVWHTIAAADETPDPNTAIGVRFHYRFSRL